MAHNHKVSKKPQHHMRLETHGASANPDGRTLHTHLGLSRYTCYTLHASANHQPVVCSRTLTQSRKRMGSAPPMLCRNALSPTNALGLSVTCPIDLCQRARPSAYLGSFRRGTRCLLLYLFHALISTCWTWRLGLSTNGTDVGAASTPTPLLAVLDALSMRAYGATPSSASSGARQ